MSEIAKTMISRSVKERLADLHPHGSEQLLRLNALALEATDPALLALCSDYIDCMLQDKSWEPPRSLTEKEKAFLAFTEQFVTSVSTMTDEQVTRLLQFASEDEVYSFVNALYVVDMTRRMDLVVGRVLP